MTTEQLQDTKVPVTASLKSAKKRQLA